MRSHHEFLFALFLWHRRHGGMTSAEWESTMVGLLSSAARAKCWVALFGAGLVASGAAVACTKKAHEPSANVKSPTTVAAAPAPAPSAAEHSDSASAKDGTVDHGSRKSRMVDPPVYVDGKQVAVIRWAEMPANLPTYVREGSESKQFYRLSDYLAGIGVPVDRVKAVHLGGKRRVWGSLTGAELRAHPERFLFHFTKRSGGKAFCDWETTYLENPQRIDYFTTIAVYVDKAEVKLHPTRHCFAIDDQECSDKVPYVDGEMPKGTRIYVDGRMVHAVKRRLAKEELILEGKGTDAPRFSLARYLDAAGIDSKSLKGVEFVAADDRVVGRANRSEWLEASKGLAFTLPRHMHGKVIAHVPEMWMAKSGEVRAKEEGTAPSEKTELDGAIVNAILLYRKTSPPKERFLFEVEEADTDPAAVQVGGIGSGTGYGVSDEEN
jgi:hypothetical protein